MKSSTRKRSALCLILLIVGAVWWYLLATHQYSRPWHRATNNHRPTFESMFEQSMNEFKQKEEEMNNMFNDLENEFLNEKEIQQKNLWDEFDNQLNDIETLSWENPQAQWTFQFIQKTNRNWEESSYEVNWNRNEWEGTGKMLIKGTNTDWKEFSFSWTMKDGQSEWTITDEDWNSKNVSFENIDINEIYENSNHIAD